MLYFYCMTDKTLSTPSSTTSEPQMYAAEGQKKRSVKDTVARIVKAAKIGVTLVLLAIFVFGAYSVWRLVSPSSGTVAVDTSRESVVSKIQSLQRVETTQFTIEKIISAGTESNNRFDELLFEDRLLLVAHGVVTAGVDVSSLHKDDVTVTGSTLTLRLPPTKILTTTLDNNKTTVYDRQQGFLIQADKDLESTARQAAQEEISKTACESDILVQAATNAQTMFEQMFLLAGFERVEVLVAAGSC